jgi:hypothetical protein
VARALTKTEEQAASEMMRQIKDRFCPDCPPACATDGKGAYREAMVATWGQVRAYKGRGRPPHVKQPGPDWRYVKVVKQRDAHRIIGVSTTVVYGDPETTLSQVGGHTAYVERTHLTSRQMNARLVRKTLSFSKQLSALQQACAWEDWVYNLTRPLKTLREEVAQPGRRWQPCSPAMAARLTDPLWTVQELLTMVARPAINSM